MKTFIDQYHNSLQQLKNELALFKDEKLLWNTLPGVSNSSGNLTLHLIGNLNHFIGANMNNSGFIRNRENEFSQKNASRKALVDEIDKLTLLIPETLLKKNESWKNEKFPLEFMNETRSNEYILVQMLTHLNYHLGQINYLRRILEVA